MNKRNSKGFKSLLVRELQHVAANRRVLFLLAGMTFLPALFLLIQVSSAWDPYGNLQKLPIGLVELDNGTIYQGKKIDIGNLVKDKLIEKNNFTYKRLTTQAEAERAVNAGEVYFAVVIPEDFSSRVAQGNSSNSSQLILITSEGTSYFANRLGNSFSSTLRDNIAQTIDQTRWSAVLDNISASKLGLKERKDGVGKLKSGAEKLHSGNTKLRGVGKNFPVESKKRPKVHSSLQKVHKI